MRAGRFGVVLVAIATIEVLGMTTAVLAGDQTSESPRHECEISAAGPAGSLQLTPEQRMAIEGEQQTGRGFREAIRQRLDDALEPLRHRFGGWPRMQARMHGGQRFFPGGPHGSRFGAPHDAAAMVLANADELDLTPAQEKEIRAAQRAERRAGIERQAEREVAELDLEALLEVEEPDLTAVRSQLEKVAALRVDERMAALRARQSLRGILTAAQRDKLEDRHADRRHRALRFRVHGGSEDRSETGSTPGEDAAWFDLDVDDHALHQDITFDVELPELESLWQELDLAPLEGWFDLEQPGSENCDPENGSPQGTDRRPDTAAEVEEVAIS